jgi:hypothetical protein
MKSLFLSMAFFIGLQAPIFAQKANPLNVEKFEKTLIEHMEISSPRVILDTILRFDTITTSAVETLFHESQVIEEAIQEVTIEKRETSLDHLHLRSKVPSMIQDSRFDELLEIFNQKEFIKEGLSGSSKIIYINGIWKGQKDAETPEEFLSFIKEIKSTIPDEIELIPTSVEDDGIDPWGDHQIFETYEYINTKGEKIEFYVGFINGQINIISCRIYHKE